MTRPARRAIAAALAITALAGACSTAGGREPERAANGPSPRATVADRPTTSTTATTATTAASGATTGTTTVRPADPPPACAYRGLGTWVDVYDHLPAFAQPGVAPPVDVADIATMAAAGVETLYFQAAKDDPRSPGDITDRALVGAFLDAAHDASIDVVAWYLPTHRDHALDLARVRAMAAFTSARGDRFDGVALDIEGIEAVTDVNERNRRLLELAAELDRAAGDIPVGSIVYPPVVFDVLNPALWPAFPWQQLATHTDVWLPMAYWTYRDASSPYRDAARYTAENIDRLRAHVGADAVVHVIGGIGDEATVADYEGFRAAAAERGAVGISVYDFQTMDQTAWSSVRTARDC